MTSIYNQSHKADPTAKSAIDNITHDDIEVARFIKAVKNMARRRCMKVANRIEVEYHGKVYK